MTLEEESERLQMLIGDLKVESAYRTSPRGLVIHFDDTTILYVDGQPDGSLDLSVVGGHRGDDE